MNALLYISPFTNRFLYLDVWLNLTSALHSFQAQIEEHRRQKSAQMPWGSRHLSRKHFLKPQSNRLTKHTDAFSRTHTRSVHSETLSASPVWLALDWTIEKHIIIIYRLNRKAHQRRRLHSTGSTSVRIILRNTVLDLFIHSINLGKTILVENLHSWPLTS